MMSRRSPMHTLAATMALAVALPASAQIFNNGPLSTGPTSNSGAAAPAGTNWSEVQNNTGNTTEANTNAGYTCTLSGATSFRLADNFTVPVGSSGWTINQVVVFAYQTGSPATPSPITSANLRIWNGSPAGGGAIACGDTTTNVLASSTDATLFRIFNSTVPAPGQPTGTTRKIWQNTLTMPAGCAGASFFTPGTYWVDYQLGVASGVAFCPSVTVVGMRGRPGDNALQFNGTAFVPAIDLGTPATAPDVPQDFPFLLNGTVPVELQSFSVD